jgi:23S rRNA (guanosine2251-2'-O)-methyltransferase
MNLICGINPVLEALSAATRHFDRLLIVKGTRNKRVSEALTRAGQMGIPLRFEARETLDRMAGGIPHQGIIAVVSAKPVIDLDTLLDQARTPAFVVVLDGVEDPRNLGAILRTVEAAGADGVVLPDRHSAGLSETVSRASAGGLEHVKVARVGNMAQALDALKQRGLWVVGFDAAGTERWDAVDLNRPVALVLGGEGRGMRRLVRERCDHLVSLPLFGHVGSLNVSVAAGIALYEVIRQRRAVPSHVKPIPPRAASPARQIEGPRADDAEEDPGHRSVYVHDDSADEDVDEVPLRVTDDEEPAWAGPTVLKPVMGRGQRADGRGRDARRRGGDRDRARRPGGAGHPRGTPSPAAASPNGAEIPGSPEGARPSAEGGRPPARGRGRGRRRRPGRGGPPGPSGAPRDGQETVPREHGGAGPRPPQAPPAPREPGTSENSGPPGASGEGGGDPARRRKRRRRRR